MKRKHVLIFTVALIILLLAILLFGCQHGESAANTKPAESTEPAATVIETAEETPPETPATTTEAALDTTTATEATTELEPETEAPAETKAPVLTEPGPATPTPTEPRPTEPKPTEPKPTEPKPTEPVPTEPKPTSTGSTETCSKWEDHTWSEWIQIKAPTSCTEEGRGEERIVCTKCGYVVQTNYPTLPHNWSAWAETKTPTCSSEGEEARNCTGCGAKETRPVNATGMHTWSETAPACTQEGVKTCTVCGKTEITSTALGHDWVHHDEKGHWQELLTCYCGAQFWSYEEWDAHFHSFYDRDDLPPEEDIHAGYEGHGIWIVDSAAYDICSRCGATR